MAGAKRRGILLRYFEEFRARQATAIGRGATGAESWVTLLVSRTRNPWPKSVADRRRWQGGTTRNSWRYSEEEQRSQRRRDAAELGDGFRVRDTRRLSARMPAARALPWLLAGVVLAGCARTVPGLPVAPAPAPDVLVDLRALDASIRIEMPYATPHNFTGVALYPVARCLLRREVAERLVRV